VPQNSLSLYAKILSYNYRLYFVLLFKSSLCEKVRGQKGLKSLKCSSAWQDRSQKQHGNVKFVALWRSSLFIVKTVYDGSGFTFASLLYRDSDFQRAQSLAALILLSPASLVFRYSDLQRLVDNWHQIILLLTFNNLCRFSKKVSKWAPRQHVVYFSF
jgi:hypothetical protein